LIEPFLVVHFANHALAGPSLAAHVEAYASIEPFLAVHIKTHASIEPFLAVHTEDQASIELCVLVELTLDKVCYFLLVLGLTLVPPLLVAYGHPLSWS
jgi:hypothetical protein